VFTQIVRDIVRNAVDQITQQIQELPDTLMQQINVSLFAAVDQIISVIRTVAEQIEQNFTDLRAFIEERIPDFQEQFQRFQETLNTLNETLISTREAILERINTAVTDIKNYLNERYDQWLREYWSPFGRVFDSFVEEVRQSFRTVEASLTGLGFMLGEVELALSGIAKTLAAIGAAVTEIGVALNGMIYEYGGTWSKTYENTSNIINLINNLPDKIIKRIEEKLDSIFDKLADEVALRIVGESHYKYDSISSFYPTITFIFKEDNVIQYPRRTQIKLRSPLMTDEVTDEYIEELKVKATFLSNLTYQHGAIKAMFVSIDKRCKPLVIVNQKEDAIHLFRVLLDFLGEPFNEGSR
jgi:hypothetical protein